MVNAEISKSGQFDVSQVYTKISDLKTMNKLKTYNSNSSEKNHFKCMHGKRTCVEVNLSMQSVHSRVFILVVQASSPGGLAYSGGTSGHVRPQGPTLAQMITPSREL